MTTEDSNIMIAKFMGIIMVAQDRLVYTDLGFNTFDGSLNGDCCTDLTKLKYDTDWDWLMPVLDKIGTLVENISTHQSETISGRWYQYTISFYNYKGFDTVKIVEVKSDYTNAESKLNTYYRAVIEFINWYNSQSK